MKNTFHQGLPASANLNMVLGIVGVCLLGIFLAWFVTDMGLLPLPKDPVHAALGGASWQFFTTVVVLYWWAAKRLRLTPADLGITRDKLGKSIALGCLLYTLALVAFVSCSNDPLIAQHGLRHANTRDTALLLLSMSIIAAGTDLTTRGFILLGLARYSPLVFAIVMQNALWYIGHLNEIALLSGCLSWGGAVGLTLTLGILGDVIALKTRNVIGLVVAHVVLNVVMMLYIKSL